jgi:hypothetical protein
MAALLGSDLGRLETGLVAADLATEAVEYGEWANVDVRACSEPVCVFDERFIFTSRENVKPQCLCECKRSVHNLDGGLRLVQPGL